jgi:uncharacterized protein (TIGR04141 family)
MGQHLTVYHIKSAFAEECRESFESLLRDPDEVLPLELKQEMTFDSPAETPFEAQLFLSTPKPSSPSWVDFLGEGFDNIPEALTQSPRAVLFVRIPYEGKKEVFAFTFGHGRYLLVATSYDQNYGLRTALNAIYEQITGGNPINPNRLRGVSSRTITANPIRTRRQADRKAAFGAFGIDIRRDLLNAITGMPMRPGVWGTRISGADSLSANPEIEFEGVGNYCKQVADTYRKVTYKQDFECIDNLGVVTNEVLKKDLEGELATEIAIPYFCFSLYESKEDAESRVEVESQTGETFVDPDDADLSVLKEKEPDAAKLLENIRELWRLEAFSDQNEVEHSWPILNCLSFETARGAKTYILSDGYFFEINPSFIKELDRFVQELPKTKPCPPDCKKSTQKKKYSEGDYNSDAASGTEPFLHMDKRLVQIQDDQENTTPIEVCDLYTEDGCFIHVKKNHGSSDLSHLFAQGSTSAVLFFNSKNYREAALAKIKESEAKRAKDTHDSSFIGRFSTFGPDRIEPKDFEVSYAIIDKWDGKELVSLPFFSKIILRKNVDDLIAMGYKVSVACINIV